MPGGMGAQKHLDTDDAGEVGVACWPWDPSDSQVTSPRDLLLWNLPHHLLIAFSWLSGTSNCPQCTAQHLFLTESTPIGTRAFSPQYFQLLYVLRIQLSPIEQVVLSFSNSMLDT